MATATWDTTYEASPADSDEAKHGASKIRDLKETIYDRMEVEHNFSTVGSPMHRAGKCSVCYYGTTTQINALTAMSEGCIAYDSTLKRFKIYTSSAWIALDIDHDTLSLSALTNPHTQYVRLSAAGQTIVQATTFSALITASAGLAVTGNITMAGTGLVDTRDVSADGAKLDALPYQTGFQARTTGLLKDTIYLATNDGFVTLFIGSVAAYNIVFYAEYAVTPPTVIIGGLLNSGVVNTWIPACFPIRKGEYWKVALLSGSISLSSTITRMYIV